MTVAATVLDAGQRGESYWFLSTLFAAAPNVSSLARLKPLAAIGAASAAADIVSTLIDETDLDQLAVRLAIEHARLFGGLREGYGPAPAYESLWREGRLMGETTVAVAKAYLETGYQPGGDWAPLDHLVEELRFVASLCNGERKFHLASQRDEEEWARQQQIQFLENHLLVWVPDYCRAVIDAAREPFFSSLARVTADVLAEDALQLRVPIQP
jgi:TorA maturation chaperone TorD